MTEKRNSEVTEKLDLTSRLFRGVERGKIKRIKFFLDLGIDVNVQNDSGYGMLIAALHIQNDEKRERTLLFLLNEGADPARRDKVFRRNAIIWACILGREKQLKRLIREYGGEIDLNERDINGMTLLHHATQGGNVTLVRCILDGLLKFELSVDIPDSLGLTPYLHAKRLGFEEIAQILRKDGKASPGQCDKYGHMNATEWSMIGEEERKRRLASKVNPPSERLERFYGYGYTSRPFKNTTSLKLLPSVHKGTSVRSLNTVCNENASTENSSSDNIVVNTESRFPSLSNLSNNHGKMKISGFDYDSQSIISLLNLSARDTEVNSFFKNHFDNAVDSYNLKQKTKASKGDFLMFMSVLSEESSPSFRRPPVAPKIEEESEAISDTRKPTNVSSLAILFGKKIKKRNSFLKTAEKNQKGGIDKNIHKKLLDVIRNSKKARAPEIKADGEE